MMYSHSIWLHEKKEEAAKSSNIIYMYAHPSRCHGDHWQGHRQTATNHPTSLPDQTAFSQCDLSYQQRPYWPVYLHFFFHVLLANRLSTMNTPETGIPSLVVTSSRHLIGMNRTSVSFHRRPSVCKQRLTMVAPPTNNTYQPSWSSHCQTFPSISASFIPV